MQPFFGPCGFHSERTTNCANFWVKHSKKPRLGTRRWAAIAQSWFTRTRLLDSVPTEDGIVKVRIVATTFRPMVLRNVEVREVLRQQSARPCGGFLSARRCSPIGEAAPARDGAG